MFIAVNMFILVLEQIAGFNTAKAATGQYGSKGNAVRVHRGIDDGMLASGVP
jgi:hypothetical protein